MLSPRSWSLTVDYAGVIFGSVAGFLLIVLAFVIWFFHRRYKKQRLARLRNPDIPEAPAQPMERAGEQSGRTARESLDRDTSEVTLFEPDATGANIHGEEELRGNSQVERRAREMDLESGLAKEAGESVDIRQRSI